MTGLPWQDWFGWPGGQVWPNLAASALAVAGGLPAVLWAHRRALLRRMRAEMVEHHLTLGDRILADLEARLGPGEDGPAPPG